MVETLEYRWRTTLEYDENVGIQVEKYTGIWWKRWNTGEKLHSNMVETLKYGLKTTLAYGETFKYGWKLPYKC